METYEIILGVFGIIILSISIIFINIIGFKYLFRVILVKKDRKQLKELLSIMDRIIVRLFNMI